MFWFLVLLGILLACTGLIVPVLLVTVFVLVFMAIWSAR